MIHAEPTTTNHSTLIAEAKQLFLGRNLAFTDDGNLPSEDVTGKCVEIVVWNRTKGHVDFVLEGGRKLAVCLISINSNQQSCACIPASWHLGTRSISVVKE